MLEAVIAALFGLLIGSFLNVCIYRMPRDLSVVRPRSCCPNCEKTIAWYDNIPVVSYVILGGRCRHCREAIPLRYPVVELLTAGLFFAAIAAHGVTPRGLKLCAFAALLIALVFSDLETMILPDEFTLGGLVQGLGFALIAPVDGAFAPIFLPYTAPRSIVSLVDAAIAASIAGASLWAVGALYKKIRGREGLGFGDVKLVAMMGAFLGPPPTLLALMLSSIAGSIVGLVWVAVKKEDIATYPLPFGSFLGAGGLLIAFAGEPLLRWYLG